MVRQFDRRSLQALRLPLICVYAHPTDYPEKFVARLWDVDKPTTMVAVADSLDGIREAKPPGMVIMQRQPEDDPVIVETWI